MDDGNLSDDDSFEKVTLAGSECNTLTNNHITLNNIPLPLPITVEPEVTLFEDDSSHLPQLPNDSEEVKVVANAGPPIAAPRTAVALPKSLGSSSLTSFGSEDREALDQLDYSKMVLIDAIDEFEDLKRDKEVLTQQNELLEKKCSELNEEIQNHIKEHHSLVAEITGLTEKREQIAKDLRQQTDETEELRQLLQQSTIEKRSIEESVHSKSSENHNLTMEIARLNKQLGIEGRRIESLQSELTLEQEKLRKNDKKVLQLQEYLEDKMRQMHELQAKIDERDRVVENLANTSSLRSTTDAEKALLLQEIDGFRMHNEALDRRVREVQEMLFESGEEQKKLNLEITVLKSQLRCKEEAETRHEHVLASAAELQSTNATLSNQLHLLRAQLHSETNEKRLISERLEELKNQQTASSSSSNPSAMDQLNKCLTKLASSNYGSTITPIPSTLQNWDDLIGALENSIESSNRNKIELVSALDESEQQSENLRKELQRVELELAKAKAVATPTASTTRKESSSSSTRVVATVDLELHHDLSLLRFLIEEAIQLGNESSSSSHSQQTHHPGMHTRHRRANRNDREEDIARDLLTTIASLQERVETLRSYGQRDTRTAEIDLASATDIRKTVNDSDSDITRINFLFRTPSGRAVKSHFDKLKTVIQNFLHGLGGELQHLYEFESDVAQFYSEIEAFGKSTADATPGTREENRRRIHKSLESCYARYTKYGNEHNFVTLDVQPLGELRNEFHFLHT